MASLTFPTTIRGMTRTIRFANPETLLAVLEHDFNVYTANPPGEPLVVSYAEYYRRGRAWDHLLHNPPVVHVKTDGEMEYFMPLIEHSPRAHPYRRAHGIDYWGWSVQRWELVPPPPVRSIT